MYKIMNQRENVRMRRVKETMEIHSKVSMETESGGRLKGLRELICEEDGMGTVEVILIIVVLVGLVIIFKEQITKIVSNLFDKITAETGKI